MGEIKQYFDNYKNRRILPKVKEGSDSTINDFFVNCIEPVLAPKENVIAWHNMFMEYVKRKDAVFLLRRYENGSKNSGRWNTRRSAMTCFKDGFAYVFVSNFEAHEIYNMAFKGVVPTANEFADLLNNHEYPMHYDNGINKSCEEIDISAYPHLGSIRSGVLNESKYYLAHIHSVNGKDYILDDGTVISKHEINKIAPRGEVSDWSMNEEFPVRRFDYSLTDVQKKYVIAHFLRLVDPLNYFLIPTKALTSFKSIVWNQNIGEYPTLVNYVSKIYEQRFDEIYTNSFCKKAMTLPICDEISSFEKCKIDITYGLENQCKVKAKIGKRSTAQDYNIRNNAISEKRKVENKFSNEIPIIFEPEDIVEFKKRLLIKKRARIKITRRDERIDMKNWNARRLTEKSNILNNIRSKSWWRKKDILGVIKIEIFIEE